MAILQSDAIAGHDCRTADAITRKLKGCDGPLPNALQWECLGYRFDRCPSFYLREAEFIREAMDSYAWREKGFLPYAGSWQDQPNIVIESFELMDQLIQMKAKSERRMMDKQKKGGM